MTAPVRRIAVIAVLVLVVTFGAVAPASGVHAGVDGETHSVEEHGGDGGDGHADEGDDGEERRSGNDSSDRRSHRGNGSDERDDGDGDGSADDGNSSLAVAVGVGADGNGGEGGFECTGSPQRHECDKGGDLAAGPLTVDYEGDNYADVPGMYGGGGDEFTVTGENRTATAGFDCDLRRETLVDGPCTVDSDTTEGDRSAAP